MAEMTPDQIAAETNEHAAILQRVTQEVEYWLAVNNKDCENKSPIAANSRGIHAVFLTYQHELQTFIHHEIGSIQPHEWFMIYKGRKNIRVFLDIINMFEAQLNHLSEISATFNDRINAKVKPLIESVEKNWKVDEVKVKDGMNKTDVLKGIEFRKHESSLRRRVLLNLEWITKDEYDLLEFCWWLRNSMHNDFSALTDKAYTFLDSETGESHTLTYAKGEIISMHSRIIYGLARCIGRILYATISKENPEPKTT